MANDFSVKAHFSVTLACSADIGEVSIGVSIETGDIKVSVNAHVPTNLTLSTNIEVVSMGVSIERSDVKGGVSDNDITDVNVDDD